jgi:hypothetical protein
MVRTVRRHPGSNRRYRFVLLLVLVLRLVPVLPAVVPMLGMVLCTPESL